MAIFTSVQQGPWNVDTTWDQGGGQTPGVGDSVVLNHRVTVPETGSPFIVGTSPVANNAVVTINPPGGILELDQDSELQVRGKINGTGTSSAVNQLTMNPGAVLRFDSSAAAGTPMYSCQLGQAADQYCNVAITGTPDKRCKVGIMPGSGRAYLEGAGGRNIVPRVEYCDFSELGDATTPAWDYPGDVAAKFLNCTFTDCGLVRIGSSVNMADFAWVRIDSCNFSGSLHATDSLWLTCNDPNVAVDRYVTNSAFDKRVRWDNPRDFTLDGSVFGEGVLVTAEAPASVDGCAFGMQGVEGFKGPYAATVSNCMFWTLLQQPNQHFYDYDNRAGTFVFENCVFDGDWNSVGDRGDVIQHANGTPSTSAMNVTVRFCLTIPHANGLDGIGVVTCQGNPNLTLSVENCTFFNHLLNVGESYAGHAGMVASCKSNIVWADGWSPSRIIDDVAGAPVTDVVPAANISHNVGYQLDAFYTDLVFSSGTPGDQDMTEDPQFVDPTVNMANWAASIGETGTYQGAVDALLMLNRTGHNPLATTANLLAYLRNGFSPRNQNYKNSSHTGSFRGAVDVSPPISEQGGGTWNPFSSSIIRG